MDFRWVAGLTLWTILSGPVFVDLFSVVRSRTRSVPVEAIEQVPATISVSANVADFAGNQEDLNGEPGQ
jgi:hypothetical protein